MRKIWTLALAAVIIAPTPVIAKSVFVRGHINRDGTYVPPHVRTAPNSTTLDNYSTRPNYNPYTGRQGTVDPYPTYPRTRNYTAPTVPRYVNPYRTRTYTPPCYYNCGDSDD